MLLSISIPLLLLIRMFISFMIIRAFYNDLLLIHDRYMCMCILCTYIQAHSHTRISTYMYIYIYIDTERYTRKYA